MAWMALCMGMGFGAVSAFNLGSSADRAVSKIQAFFFMVQAIALLFSRIFAGRMADRYGRSAINLPRLDLRRYCNGNSAIGP